MSEAQIRTVARLRRTADWQDIARDDAGTVILTTAVGIRWVDANVALDGSVSYSRPQYA